MKLIKIILAMAGLVAAPIVTIAGEDSQLTINEQPFVTSVAAPAHLENVDTIYSCLLYTSPSPRDEKVSRMPSSA